MISDFICEDIGFLSCDIDGEIELVREIIEPGKNSDGWWNAERLLKQVCCLN